jgi:hypothetical protein
MRLDHVSYVASHDQISDVVNRIGSQIGTAFIDGGIHPKFGTRNFTAPLLNGQYIEVVCPMDHPATDATPFGRAVRKKAEEGGGWMTWVISTSNIQKIEDKLSRSAVIATRKLPNGSELEWKQIGVLSTLEDPGVPFFIEWISQAHPSQTSIAVASIKSILIIGNQTKVEKQLGIDYKSLLGSIEIKWVDESANHSSLGIEEIEFEFNSHDIKIN